MLIKQQALASYLSKQTTNQPLAGVYIIIGQDLFLLDDAARCLKSAWRKLNTNDEVEETIFPISTPADWVLLDKEAYSYSLFTNERLIDIRYEKKTLETAGKNFLTNYLNNINPHCLLLLRAPNLPLTQAAGFAKSQNAYVIPITPFNNTTMQHWITEQLGKKGIAFQQEVPVLIHQYTQGNMLACSQMLEKIDLIADKKVTLTKEMIQEYLIDQCEYQLFELGSACLSPHPDKVIQLLRYAYNTHVEPTLILWLLTQEIRLLIQLASLIQQSIPFNAACTQLKIWSQRSQLYQSALKTKSLPHLLKLLQYSRVIDECIKSNQSTHSWQLLEQLALSICLNKQVGHFA